MHKEYILLNGFRKAKKGFTAWFHVPLRVKFRVRARNIVKLKPPWPSG